MTAIARALAEALGLAPRPWSESKVLRVLRKWLVLQASRRTGEPALDRGNVFEEPGWILLSCTIAAKLARCPANPIHELGTDMPAVELVVRAEMELDTMRAEWERWRLAEERTGGQVRANIIRQYEEEVRYATMSINRIRASSAYMRGIAYLGQEFAWCSRLDKGFNTWANLVGG